jgi:hypothetical protein
MGSLTITYQAPGQRPLSVATIEDDGLLRKAAQLALVQAERRAAASAVDDPVMGMLQAAEVRRLRAALSILVPGFDAPSDLNAALQ